MSLKFSSFIPGIFIVMITLRTVTCYYVRYWYRRYLTFHPATCNTNQYICKKEGAFAKLRGLLTRVFYTGDGKLFYMHKYFIWTTILLLPFHVIEVFPVFLKSWAQGASFQTLDVSIELAYLAFGVLFAVSCHSIKYFFDKRGQCEDCAYSRKAFHAVSRLNLKHGFFLWATVFLLGVRFILLLVYGIDFFTAAQMLFVRLPEN